MGMAPGARHRITPACAGSTYCPRHVPLLNAGSPPPARGAPGVPCPAHAERRITPACAGSTTFTMSRLPTVTDHPRLRGEHMFVISTAPTVCGSPPPARGAPGRGDDRLARCRITPACAGSTDRHRSSRGGAPGSPPPARGARRSAGASLRVTHSDHPRLRGEHAGCARQRCCVVGSPPPARGAPGPARRGIPSAGITPACAGSTREVSCALAGVCGSPPPARGAPLRGQVADRHLRITPACAGST